MQMGDVQEDIEVMDHVMTFDLKTATDAELRVALRYLERDRERRTAALRAKLKALKEVA